MRFRWRSFGVACVVVAAMVHLALAQETTRPTTAPSTRPVRVKNPPGAIDKLVQIDTASTWSDGTFSNATVHADYPPRIELAYKDSDFPRVGTWTTPESK